MSITHNQRQRTFPLVTKHEVKIDQGKGVKITAVKHPKNAEQQIYYKSSQKIKNKIIAENCLSDMKTNLARSLLRQQFPSILGLEHRRRGFRNMFIVRMKRFF